MKEVIFAHEHLKLLLLIVDVTTILFQKEPAGFQESLQVKGHFALAEASVKVREI